MALALPTLLVIKTSHTAVKSLGSRPSPSPELAPFTEVCPLNSGDRLSLVLHPRVSIVTTITSKVPESLPPTSDFLPPCVPFR